MKSIFTSIILTLFSLPLLIGQNDVVFSANDNWVGFMNVFNLDGSYNFGSGWGVPDLKTVIDEGANTMTLQPNFNTYADNPMDPFWVDQTTGEGAKTMEASTFVEPGETFNGNDLTFSGVVQENTLDGDYTAQYFIKALDPDNGFADALEGSKTFDLPDSGAFSVSATGAELAPGLVIQYGFVIMGRNANPDNEAALGSVVIGTAESGSDMCTDAVDISNQFGQALGVIQSSGPYNNTEATTDASDPDFGWECFGEPDGAGGAPSLERTLWYSFTGDGESYFIEALACGDDPIDFSDTQFAIYTGDCDNLEAVLCSEDGPNADEGYFPAGDTLQTEAGVTYYMMVDGFGPDFPTEGDFCIEVTKLTGEAETVMVTFQVDATLLVDEGELAADGMFLAGSFSDFNNIAMEDMDSDNIWTAEVEIDAGTSQEYKFKNGADGWENIDTSLGDDCTTGDFGNRALEVGDMSMTLDPVCFSYCVSCMIVDVDEAALESGISVFPNPVQDVLSVQVDLPAAAQSLDVRLLNMLGQVVLSGNYGQLQSDNIELDMSQLPAGTYLLQVRDGRAQFAQPVVIQR